MFPQREDLHETSFTYEVVQKLRWTNASLLSQVKSLKRQLHEKDKRLKMQKKEIKKSVQEILSTCFTPGQIKMLLNPMQKKTRWSSEDIASAISLRSVSPKAYRYLKKTRKIPLPGMSTLRRWVGSFKIDEGILDDVLLIMKHKGESMTDVEKITVICFDEIHLSNQIAIERRSERVIGPHKKCQVVVARGLVKKWKQPIYYDFDQDLTKETLLKIITKLHENGYMVFAMTSDLGPANQKLLKTLHIDVSKDVVQTWFQHPCDENIKIHVFLDVPHLIKLLRNHFFDSGIRINGKFITSAALKRLLQINSGDLKIAHKLSQVHLDVQGTQRQNVKLATQIFSATNADAILWCGSQGLMNDCPEWAATAEFLKMFNDWFDVFNSVCKYGYHPGLNGYGVNIVEQQKILAEITETVKSMKVGFRQAMLPFQKGILVSNSSLQNLYRDLTERFNTKNSQVLYITTNRLNQDVLENMFAYLRAMGAANDKPTAIDMRYRLRWYVLGKHSADVFTQGSNTIAHESNVNEKCLTSGIDALDAKEMPATDDEEFNIANVTHFQDDFSDTSEGSPFLHDAECGKIFFS